MKLLLFILLLPALLSQDTPTLVVEIFRHGIRSPESSLYDTNKIWNSIGYGELTPAGMRQQYILGAVLAEEYPSLLQTAYEPWKIYIQSASENRTIVSAQSQLFGIYNGTGPNMPGGYNDSLSAPPYNNANVTLEIANLVNMSSALPDQYSPIPVHSAPPTGDYLLLGYLNCPNSNSIFHAHTNDSTVQTVFAELNDTVNTLATEYNITADTVSDFDDLGDFVMSNAANNAPLPGNISVDSQVYKDLLFFTQWYEIYPVLATPDQQQVFAGPFLYNLLGLFQATVKGTSAKTFVFYAAKETMLSIILNALGIMNPTCLRTNWEETRSGQNASNPGCQYPIFASTLIFEFYNTSAPYIMVKYQGNYTQVCGNSTSCSLSDFTNLVNQTTNGTTLANFMSWCGVNQTTNNTIIERVEVPVDVPAKFGTLDIVLIVVCVVLAVSLGIVGYKAKQLKKKVDDRYENFELKV